MIAVVPVRVSVHLDRRKLYEVEIDVGRVVILLQIPLCYRVKNLWPVRVLKIGCVDTLTSIELVSHAR